MSESPTRRIVASAPGEASSEVVAASEELAIGTSHRHRGIKSRHFRAPPPSSHRLLRRVLAACLACALVVAVFKARAPSSSPPQQSDNAVYVSPLPEYAVAAAAKAAGEITATTAAAFGLNPGAAATSKLPLPSVGLPKPHPRAADRIKEEDEHAGETQQAFFDRVLLDRVEAVDVFAFPSPSSSSSLSSSSSTTPPPPAPHLAAKAVRAAAAHAWAGYVSHAWGEDELAPVSRTGREAFCSLAVTAVDALDTLLLLGMNEEFARARSWLLAELPGRLRGPCAVSVFEATIRVVGGLASAADLSGDGGGGVEGGAALAADPNSSNSNSSSAAPACSSLGDLAALAAEALLPAFNVAYPGGGSGSDKGGGPRRRLVLPVSEVELGTGEPLAADVAAFGPDGASGTALLAEAGSLGPEFWRAGYWKAASELKKRKKKENGGGGEGLAVARALAAAGASAVDAILAANDPFGSSAADGSAEGIPLPPTTLSLSDATAAWSERHTVGGRTDSYYEYLLKMWLMLRRAAEEAEEAERAATTATATATARNSSSSSSASGFVRDRQAEQEALSYISASSSSVSAEDAKRPRGHHHSLGHHHHRHERAGSPQTPTTPLARRAELYRRAWLAAADEILDKLVRETPGGSRYLTSDMGEPVMEHLACFFPGNLALGVLSGAVSGRNMRSTAGGDGGDDAALEREQRYLAAAGVLAETCALAGEGTATGLAPEVVLFLPEARPGHPFSLLRPEAIESFFYLWRATKDPKWRQHGWNTFVALERHAKVPSGGFSAIRDVTVTPATKDDSQPSWLLAETFKYLFLLFSEDSTLDLDEFVLNTEAHPLRVFGEKKKREQKMKERGEEEEKAVVSSEEEEEFQGQRRRLPRQESKSSSSSSSSSSRRHLKP